MSTIPDHPLLQQIGELARRAGDAILAIYREDFDVEIKADHSPLTAADLAAQQVIAAGLAQLQPVLPVVSGAWRTTLLGEIARHDLMLAVQDRMTEARPA